MPTRFYLPSNVIANYSSSAVTWGQTTGTIFRMIQTATQLNSQVSSYVTTAVTKSSTTNPLNCRSVQLFSRPLKAQTIAVGTVKGILRTLEGAISADANAQMIISVVSNTAGAVRGTVLAANSAALSNEFDTVLTNRKFPVNWSGSGTATTSVAAQLGDLLMIEIGARFYTALSGGTNTATFELGYDSLQPDLAENETGTTAGNGWIEFSQNIEFIDDGFTTTYKPHYGYEGAIVLADNVELVGQGVYTQPVGVGVQQSNDTGTSVSWSFGTRAGTSEANSITPVGRGTYSEPVGVGLQQNNDTFTTNRFEGSRGGLTEANNIEPVGRGVYSDLTGVGLRTEPSSTETEAFTVNSPRPLFSEGGGGPVVVTYYSLAAYDSVARRYWTSTTIDFASAPIPVGAWDVASLTVLASWT